MASWRRNFLKLNQSVGGIISGVLVVKTGGSGDTTFQSRDPGSGDACRGACLHRSDVNQSVDKANGHSKNRVGRHWLQMTGVCGFIDSQI